MRRIFAAALVASAAAALLAPVAARADDLLSGMTPLSNGSLGAVTIRNNTFTSSDVTNHGTVTGNTVGADRGGRVINGAIESNSITNNRGLTSVLMNTGNNVVFNNATVVNVILPAAR